MERELETIIDNYGYEKQSRKAIEELGELIVAINKNIDNPGNKALFDNLVEEIADVEIMLEQLKMIHDIENHELIKIKNKKINRELERINKATSKKDPFNIEKIKDVIKDNSEKINEAAKKIKDCSVNGFYNKCDTNYFNLDKVIAEEEKKDEEALQNYMREQEKQEVIKIFTNFLEGYYGK